jgi:methyl-accepting chemotaxis protein
VRERIDQSAALSSDANQRAEATEVEIAALLAATGEITSVIDLIRTISEKTKILALNAQVEAMRAGSAGRTFVVVAEEVKSLAAETARAVDEVAGQVQAVRARTGETAGHVRTIIDAVSRIDSATAQAAAAVGEQAAASEAIAQDAERARVQSAAVRDQAAAASGAALSGAKAAEAVAESSGAAGDRLSALRDGLTQFLQQTEQLEQQS